MRIGLLPIIIIACLLLLALKISNIFGYYDLTYKFEIISSAYAKESTDDAPQDEDGKISSTPPEISTSQTITYTPTELDILQRLAERRKELEQWEKDLGIKESILKITQEKIDYKIEELRELKTHVEKILEEYNAKESKKIQSLVKIYENMKPKSAAKIFSELDMNTMLSVSEKMKEDKLALILAKMEPVLAKDLTVRFANHGKLIPPKQQTR